MPCVMLITSENWKEPENRTNNHGPITYQLAKSME